MIKRRTGIISRSTCAVWLLWLASFVAVFLYVASDLSKTMALSIPVGSVNSLHIVFGVLTNSLLIPIQHWISLLVLLYSVCKPFSSPEMIIRYKTKQLLRKAVTRKAVISALCISAANITLTVNLSILLYGLPQTESWSKFPFTNIPLPVVIGTAFAVRCTISVFVAYVFISGILLLCKPEICAVGIAVWLVLCDLGRLLTPPYLSFKAVFFSSSFSFAFFLSDGYLENLLLSIVLPFGLIAIMAILSNTLMKHFPERWAES